MITHLHTITQQLNLKQLMSQEFRSSRQLCLLPLWLGLLVAVAIPLFEHHPGGYNGVSPLISLIAIAFGMRHLVLGRAVQADRWDWITAVILALVFILPSQQLSWVLLMAVSGWCLLRGDMDPLSRRCFLLIISVAVINLVALYTLKILAAPVLSLDAALVTWWIEWIHDEGSRLGNIVYGPADHELLILRGCSSVKLFADALAAWFIVARSRGLMPSRNEFAILIALCTLLAILNMLRLYSMALDQQWHTWWHTELGLQVFQILAIVIVFSVISRGLKYVEKH